MKKKCMRALLALALLLCMLLILPWLMPLGGFIPRLEQQATASLGVPVRAGSLRLSLLPAPHLTISRLAVGAGDVLIAEQVAVLPSLLPLLSGRFVVARVMVEDVRLKSGAIEMLASMTSSASTSSPAVQLGRLSLRRVKLDWPEMVLPTMDIDIALTALNTLRSAQLRSVDNKLQMDLEPDTDGYAISATAKDWVLPFGPPLLMDQLNMRLRLQGQALHIQSMRAAMYQGQLSAEGKLSWLGPWQLDGVFKLDKLALQEPVTLLSGKRRLSGHLFADGKLSARASEPGSLAQTLKADVQFRVEDGVLYGLDLARAASLLLKQGAQGGETQFDRLSGQLDAVGARYQFRQLKIASGLLTGEGKLTIMPEKTLDGVMQVALKRSVSLVAIPLQVSGTLAQPTVFPTKAALAGAAAGTALMGPGVGTSLGVKAAGAVDKLKGLFGGSKD